MSTHTTLPNQFQATHGIHADQSAGEIFGLRSLFDETFQPMKWAVQDLIPEGCVLFAGRPKLGKSWFVLQLALDVASGGKALGQIPVEQSDVLYLALEDTKRRLQSRAKQLLGDKPLPDGLNMAVGWPRLDEGGSEKLESWLSQSPQTRLVIVDTFGKIKSRQRGGDYETLSRLVQIAHRFGICLLVVHHTRKADAQDAFDTVSGPTETASLADAMLVMKRARCTSNAELHITGRDLEESKKALRFDSKALSWELLGDADQVWQSQLRAEITKLLRVEGRSMKPAEIADCLDKSHGGVRKTLSRMVADNQILWITGGFYELKENDKCADESERTQREQIRKERTESFKESLERLYGDEAKESDFNWGTLDITDEFLLQIKRAYGKEPATSEIKVEQAESQDQARPPEETVPSNKSPAELEPVEKEIEPTIEDFWARYRQKLW